MAHSIFLSRLNNSERKTLIERLWNIQKGKCFISGQDIATIHQIDSIDEEGWD